jgi:GNAT superfamily N-acetyltransferase
MPISYANEPDLPAEEFRGVLVASSLGARRPIGDLARLNEMLRRADLVLTARDGALLVGVARSIADFSYCCYLSDLAVASSHQRQGIGRRLVAETRERAGEQATLLLVAAPDAAGYYDHIGLQHIPGCWAIPRTR